MSSSGLYVETFIRGSLEELWSKTQLPDQHQRWDLRFSTIEYLPKDSPESPQRFRYATRIGFGMTIAGEGESVATVPAQESGGREEGRSSSLRFSSDDSRSLIRTGSGYWKYQPQEDGVRFWTWYDYQTRFGALGRLFDRALFRPLMGWATAWSFDRLRLWIERGLDPAQTLRRAASHALARASLILIFVYHGLVPKLMRRDADELAMLRAGGVPEERIDQALLAMGTAELAWAFVLLAFGSKGWPYLVTILGMGAALGMVAIQSPAYLGQAFNPVTLNLGVASLAGIAWMQARDRPSARRCLRQKPKES